MAKKNTMPADRTLWMEDAESLVLIRKSLMRIALARMPQASDAEEVVQQAIQALLENDPTVHLKTTPLQYGVGILKNQIREYYRAAARNQREEAGQDLVASGSPDEELRAVELRELVKKHVKNLPRDCRRIFAHLYLGYTPFEMQSRIKAPSLEALRMRVSRCRRGLKKLLARSGWEIGGTKAEVSIFEQCTDPTIGSSLPFYEAGSLNELEKRRFEHHVAECSYCAGELYDFLEVSEILQEERRWLSFGSGVRPSPSLRSLLELPTPGLPKPEDIAALQGGFKYWARIGSQVLVVAILLTMAWPGAFFSGQRDEPEWAEELVFRLPKQPPLLGFWAETQEDAEIAEALQLYRDRRFFATLRRLAAISREEPAHWQVYFIAGMSNLYLRIADQAAISLLKKSLASAEGFEPQVRWYLAAAYWQADQHEDAIEQLRQIASYDGSFKAEAQEALRRIQRQGYAFPK